RDGERAVDLSVDDGFVFAVGFVWRRAHIYGDGARENRKRLPLAVDVPSSAAHESTADQGFVDWLKLVHLTPTAEKPFNRRLDTGARVVAVHRQQLRPGLLAGHRRQRAGWVLTQGQDQGPLDGHVLLGRQSLRKALGLDAQRIEQMNDVAAQS